MPLKDYENKRELESTSEPKGNRNERDRPEKYDELIKDNF